MVISNVDMLIQKPVVQLRMRVQVCVCRECIGVEVQLRKVVVLAEVVVCGHHPSSHIRRPPLWNAAVEHGLREVWTPEADAQPFHAVGACLAKYGSVHSCKSGKHTVMLAAIVRDDEAGRVSEMTLTFGSSPYP